MLDSSSDASAQASKHSVFLSQLHPQLPLPTLEGQAAPSSTGWQHMDGTLPGPPAARSSAAPHTWALARLQYASARSAVLHGPAAAHSQQAMPSSLLHTARQPLGESKRSPPQLLDEHAASAKRPKHAHSRVDTAEAAPSGLVKQEDSTGSGPGTGGTAAHSGAGNAELLFEVTVKKKHTNSNNDVSVMMRYLMVIGLPTLFLSISETCSVSAHALRTPSQQCGKQSYPSVIGVCHAGKGLLAVQDMVEASLWASSAPVNAPEVQELASAVTGLRRGFSFSLGSVVDCFSGPRQDLTATAGIVQALGAALLCALAVSWHA